jgi:tRNA pseudouridine65 synthase
MNNSTLEILFEDEWLVAINKPHNLLVHRTHISEEKEHFALQMLKEQLGIWLTPCHRLDRKTSGILLFAKNKEAGKLAMKMFENHEFEKEYITLVRGFIADEGKIDKPLAKENGTLQDAFTRFKRMQTFEIPIEVSRYPTSRYSLVQVMPTTGRMHQIRRHMASLRHYVIGDKVHGERHHNKMFEEKFGLDTMLLHANLLRFKHPMTGNPIQINATLHPEFEKILTQLTVLSEQLSTKSKLI